LVSALDATNVALKKVLVELHAVADATKDMELDHRIVRLMQTWAERRQVLLPAM
jgi:type IV secretory pathway VirB3-like protein